MPNTRAPASWCVKQGYCWRLPLAEQAGGVVVVFFAGACADFPIGRPLLN